MNTIAAANPAKTAPKIPSSIERIVLTGFMGAGKTSIGKLLATSLDWQFLDLDQHLEARAGASIPALFEQHGEPQFRRLESAALANALARHHTVIALGGGTPEQLTNRLLLEQTPGTTIIFLDAPFSTLFDRCMLQGFATPDHVRPLLRDPAQAQARFEVRLPLYRRLARFTTSTEERSTSQVAAVLLAHLAG